MLYPVLTPSRCLMDLCGTWEFQQDLNNEGFDQKWYAGPLPSPITMPVPASYNDIKEDEKLKEHYGWVFYQRTVSIPLVCLGQRILLRMEAVTHKARIYWNDTLICEHKGGFLPFEACIPQNLIAATNRLTIAVDNKIDLSTLPVGGDRPFFTKEPVKNQTVNYPRFDFFNYCGIHRPVKIYTTPVDYIEDITITSEITDILTNPSATLNYKVDTKGADLPVTVEIYDANGLLVGQGQGSCGSIHVDNVHLWGPGDGYLYDVKVTYGDDTYTLPYGIRSVRVEGTRFLINEKPFYFKGYGKHEDTFPNGRGYHPAMNAKDMSLMQWQNANSFRTSHYPYSEEMMRLCDREGMVVIDETPAVGVGLKFGGGISPYCKDVVTYKPIEEGGIATFQHHQEVVRDLIDRDKNYACVVMWSIANEPDSDSPGAYEYFKPLFDLAKSLDPQNRPCTVVVMKGAYWQEDITIQLSDVICLNRYYGWYDFGGELDKAEEELRKEIAWWSELGKPIMITEYGADTVAGMHDTIPTMFTEEYQVAFYKINNKVLDEFPCIVGEHAWNFADFATVQGTGRVQGNKKGVFTRDRKPKMAAYYFKERWSNIPDFNYK